MKREIKFRAWDSKYKVMLCNEFNLIGEVTIFGGIEQTLAEQSQLHNDTTPSLLRLNDVVVMQYTGLKDANGKEIYEGDIVTNGGVVQWVTDVCSFCINYPNIEMMEFDSDVNDWCVVQGNIYENPYLL